MLYEVITNSGIPEDDAVRWTYYHYREEEQELLIRTTLRNTYEIARTPFGSKPCINPEMALAIATEEFMNRITSYNVCYTKLLRRSPSAAECNFRTAHSR